VNAAELGVYDAPRPVDERAECVNVVVLPHSCAHAHTDTHRQSRGRAGECVRRPQTSTGERGAALARVCEDKKEPWRTDAIRSRPMPVSTQGRSSGWSSPLSVR
jgi:hypothetical protein